MKANSTEYPQQTVQRRQNGYAIIFDILETEEGFEYNEVISTSIDLNPITSAIVRQYYSHDDEMQIINDYLVNGTSNQWEAYQAIRAKAKVIATGIVDA